MRTAAEIGLLLGRCTFQVCDTVCLREVCLSTSGGRLERHRGRGGRDIGIRLLHMLKNQPVNIQTKRKEIKPHLQVVFSLNMKNLQLSVECLKKDTVLMPCLIPDNMLAFL